ncbi:zinc finger BED domain-containing protein 5-like [Hydra vulgaris]|uniref:Zinc finger BED domain-containing protein 5-like n=1 Tax=Hydra vulgaris TaxID=6087 RepID=A0ABM4BNH8_HYDVU
MKNITPCAADGATNMMGKKNGCLKLMKDENPDMLLVHCVVHRENLVAKNLSPVLNKITILVVKCINSIKVSTKQERIFKLYCEENNEPHVRLLLYTEVRWLSKGNCLKRFMELFDTLSGFLSDKTEMQYLLTIHSKAYLSYLTDIFEKLKMLNKELQETNKTLVDVKAKIFDCITSIELFEKDVYQKQAIITVSVNSKM